MISSHVLTPLLFATNYDLLALYQSKTEIILARQLAIKTDLTCNRSKTSASFSSGVPNTEKQMKARRRRRSAFIVSRCLEPLMKNEARVFELASQTSMRIFFEE